MCWAQTIVCISLMIFKTRRELFINIYCYFLVIVDSASVLIWHMCATSHSEWT